MRAFITYMRSLATMSAFGCLLLPVTTLAQSPACGSTNIPAGNLTLSWPDQGPDYYYRVTLAWDPNMLDQITQFTMSGTQTPFSVIAGVTYGWTLEKALIGTQVWSGVIGVCTFTTTCGVLSQTPWISSGPGSSGSLGYNVDPAFSYVGFQVDAGAVFVHQFEFQYSTDPSFPAGNTQIDLLPTGLWQGVYSTSYSFNNLLPGTRYYYRVRAMNDCGAQGPWASSGFHTRTSPKTLNLKMFLKGPLNASTLLMSDALRVGGLITAPPWISIAPSVLTTTGSNAVVDWVSVGVSDPFAGPDDSFYVNGLDWLLVQRDGDIIDPTTGLAPTITFPLGYFTLSFHHRNHLPVSLANPINANASSTINVDITQLSTPLYGTEPTSTVNGRRALWPGDIDRDGFVRYTGVGNDRDMVLQRIGGVIPTSTAGGYLPEDLNLDGIVKYTGLNNDRDLILQTIGGVVPTAVRQGQVP